MLNNTPKIVRVLQSNWHSLNSVLEAAGGRQFHGTILQCPSAVEAKQLMSQDSRSYSLLKVIMCNSSIFTRIYSRDLK
jgi:hypothetical protein